MKIVHAVYSLEMGGAEMLVAQLSRVQRAHGHDVRIFAYSCLGELGQLLRSEGFEVYVPGAAHPLLTIWRYYKKLSKVRPDVVHCHNVAPTIHAAFSAHLANVRMILTTRHSLVQPPYSLIEELKFNLAAIWCRAIVGICDTTCENLRAIPLAHRPKILRVYNGVPRLEVPTELTKGEATEDKDGFLLLFVGRLAPVKDLGTLLRAVALAREVVQGLQLWLVGDGPSREELQVLITDLNLAGCAHLCGLQMETAGYYSAADAFIMSSLSEGLPMSLLQALSFGLPTITTDVGGMAETQRNFRCGVLSKVGDHEALASSIIVMATDKTARDAFAKRALEAYEAHFTLETMYHNYQMVYCSKFGNGFDYEGCQA